MMDYLKELKDLFEEVFIWNDDIIEEKEDFAEDFHNKLSSILEDIHSNCDLPQKELALQIIYSTSNKIQEVKHNLPLNNYHSYLIDISNTINYNIKYFPTIWANQLLFPEQTHPFFTNLPSYLQNEQFIIDFYIEKYIKSKEEKLDYLMQYIKYCRKNNLDYSLESKLKEMRQQIKSIESGSNQFVSQLVSLATLPTPVVEDTVIIELFNLLEPYLDMSADEFAKFMKLENKTINFKVTTKVYVAASISIILIRKLILLNSDIDTKLFAYNLNNEVVIFSDMRDKIKGYIAHLRLLDINIKPKGSDRYLKTPIKNMLHKLEEIIGIKFKDFL